jgi:hypothetical protein
MHYRDFELRIHSDRQGKRRTGLVRSPSGVAEGPFELPFTEAAVEGLLAGFERQVRGVRMEEGETAPAERNLVGLPAVEELPELSKLGGQLFEALIAGEVSKRYFQAVGEIGASGGEEGLRFLLGYDSDDLSLAQVAALPWELLSEAGDQFLALARATPVVRYLPLGGPDIWPRAGTLRLLVVRSAPIDLPPLDLQGELERIWHPFADRPDVEIEVLDHPTLAELRGRLIDERWHVLHFMGHGGFDAATGEGVLCFEGRGTKAERVKAKILGQHLKGARDLRLVVLNTCASGRVPRSAGQSPYTALAPALLRAGVPAVLAMQFPISDNAAIAFSADLYARLARGDRIDAAVVEGRLAILRTDESSCEWATPILFTRVTAGDILGGNGRMDIAPPPKRQEELRRLGLRSFKDTGDAFVYGSEMESERAEVLDLRKYFGGPNGRYIQEPAWWQTKIFPELRAFLAGPAAERRPIHFNFAAHGSIAFAAGYCLEAKSGLDITIRQRGEGGTREWHPRVGVLPDGPLFQDEEDLPGDPNARDVACAIGITQTIAPEVAFYLERSGTRVRRILPVTLAGAPGPSGVRDGLHALALAEDLAERIRRRTVHERDGMLHLFASAPAALLFFLGQLARAFGPVQLYEHDFGSGHFGAYRPSILLPPLAKVPPEPHPLPSG